MDAEAQRLLKDFTTHLNRTVPQPEPAEWPRLYDFIIHVTRRQAPSAEAVGQDDFRRARPPARRASRASARKGSHHASLACEADGNEEAGSCPEAQESLGRSA